jgi:hypothetical protein
MPFWPHRRQAGNPYSVRSRVLSVASAILPAQSESGRWRAIPVSKWRPGPACAWIGKKNGSFSLDHRRLLGRRTGRASHDTHIPTPGMWGTRFIHRISDGRSGKKNESRFRTTPTSQNQGCGAPGLPTSQHEGCGAPVVSIIVCFPFLSDRGYGGPRYLLQSVSLVSLACDCDLESGAVSRERRSALFDFLLLPATPLFGNT